MASQKDELFGQIVVERGHVTHQQLDEARENQRVMRESMGMHAALADVLVHKRLLTKDQARDIRHEVELRTGEVHLVAGYEIVSELGEGGYGVVYRARQVGTDDYVALKIILPTKADEETINRFRRRLPFGSRARAVLLRRREVVGRCPLPEPSRPAVL